MISDKCPHKKCDGTGIIFLVKSHGETVGKECVCKSYKEYLLKLETAKIPLDFIDATVSTFDCSIYDDSNNQSLAEAAKAFAISFVKNFEDFNESGKGIYFYSSIKGSGKTRLSVSILNALIKNYNVNAMYISSVNMLNELKKTFNHDANTSSYELIKMFSKIDVLLIDDLAVEKATDWSEEIITQILEDRMNFRRVTIFTSNLEISQLDNKYKGGRISSRIEKMTFPLHMPTESVRSKIAAMENEQIIKKYFD